MQLQTDGIMGILLPRQSFSKLVYLFPEMPRGRNHQVLVEEFKNDSLDLLLYNISKRTLQFEDRMC